jgi:transposase
MRFFRETLSRQGDSRRFAGNRRHPTQIVKRSDIQGFVLLHKRWILERTYGWLGRCRRLAKDFEHLTRSHVCFVQHAMIRLMSRRIERPQIAT